VALVHGTAVVTNDVFSLRESMMASSRQTSGTPTGRAHCHTSVLRNETKPLYVCPGCSNARYGEQIQYLAKLQARIFTK
jgi:hypothetical protein